MSQQTLRLAGLVGVMWCGEPVSLLSKVAPGTAVLGNIRGRKASLDTQ